MNTGIPGPPLPGEAQNPIHLDRVCVRFPELRLCMIHGADPWWDTAIRLMLKYRNLRLMTSAWSPKRLPESLLHYMRTRGKDRILFASDYPVLSMERCLGEAAALDLPDEVRTPGSTTTPRPSSSETTETDAQRRMPMDARPIDADNHYYEPLDAFTRHLDKEFAERGVQPVQDGKRVEAADRAARSTGSSPTRPSTRSSCPAASTRCSAARSPRASTPAP